MHIRYEVNADVFTITFRDVRIEESDEITPNVIADFGENGEVVGLEVLSASQVIENLDDVRYEKMA